MPDLSNSTMLKLELTVKGTQKLFETVEIKKEPVQVKQEQAEINPVVSGKQVCSRVNDVLQGWKMADLSWSRWILEGTVQSSLLFSRPAVDFTYRQ